MKHNRVFLLYIFLPSAPAQVSNVFSLWFCEKIVSKKEDLLLLNN